MLKAQQRLRLAIPLLGLLISETGPVRAQDASAGLMNERLEAVERAIKALQEQLAAIRNPNNPQHSEDIEPIRLDITDSPSLGLADAQLAIIEYSDFQCPFCARHSLTTMLDIRRQFIEPGMVRYVFRHLPIERIHPFALKAARAAQCADRSGRFWEMHHKLFASQNALADADLEAYARAMGIPAAEFIPCLDEPRTVDKVNSDAAEARRLGARATPTFLVGEVVSKNIVIVRKRITGAQSVAVFQAVLQDMLRSGGNKDSRQTIQK